MSACETAGVAFLYRLLPPRPTFPADMSSEEGMVMQRHSAYWQDLLERRIALAYGPVLDPRGSWGLGLLEVDDEDRARDIGEADPAVASRVCTYEVLPVDLVKPR